MGGKERSLNFPNKTPQKMKDHFLHKSDILRGRYTPPSAHPLVGTPHATMRSSPSSSDDDAPRRQGAREERPLLASSASASASVVEGRARAERLRSRRMLAAGVGIVLLVAVLTALAAFDAYSRYVELLEWLRAHPHKGAWVFVGVTVAANLLVVPGSLMWLSAGFAFRPYWVAVAAAMGGSALGLSAAFLAGRYVLRSWMVDEIAARPSWGAVDRAIRHRGWKLVCLLRLAMFPYNFGNYALGATSVPFRHYVPASVAGITPSVLLFSYLGSLARDAHSLARGEEESSRTKTLLMVGSAVAVTAVMAGVGVWARRVANEELREEAEREDEV